MQPNPLPAGPFGLILADPPWAFRTFSGATRTPTQKKFNEPEDHYATMPLGEIMALPVSDVAARDSLLTMWVVGSHIGEAIALGEAWGFSFVTDLFYWLKQRLIAADQIDLFTGDIAEPKISMGYHTRKQLEPCLLFKRGKGLPVLSHSGTTSISRWATSMLEAVGLDEMVATDLEQYEERACYLATHSDAMIEIKARLAQNRLTLPLFDTERHVRDLESAYQMMWQRYISGAPPDSFHVTNRA